MILIISPEQALDGETTYTNAFFQHGLDLFHVRKYDFSTEEMKTYLDRIDINYRSQLVLHSHYDLADAYGIKRLHFGEKKREEQIHKNFSKYIRSTSVHNINDFNTLSADWIYAFLSPIFPSISKKNYGQGSNVLTELARRQNFTVGLVALGGIEAQNINKIRTQGADSIALLGTIWQSKNPLKEYIKCRKISQWY